LLRLSRCRPARRLPRRAVDAADRPGRSVHGRDVAALRPRQQADARARSGHPAHRRFHRRPTGAPGAASREHRMTVKLFTPPTLPKRGGYSQVCEVTKGKLILVAGQVPHDVNDKMVGEGSFETQVDQVFKNLDAALKAAGGSMKNLVKIMNYCVATVSYEERMVYRTVRDRWVDTPTPPVSTFIYVVKLAQPNWLFEMDAMAVIDG